MTIMRDLIPTISNVIKLGLEPNLRIEDKELILEKDLVRIYSLYFQIVYKPDDVDYPSFKTPSLPDIRQNVCSNFPDYDQYKTHLDINNLDDLQDTAIGDAIDDLTDIIRDLIEVKWRIENNGINDGLWFFEHSFRTHTQQHLIDLLNYMKQKNR
ncbi:MAG: DUF5063 domain-containing protein [Candidatus Brocadia sp. WS118]|nr:MAG: DUF5063 domain-containing protein [Candidatus Brocadia sp. WS118]